MADKKVKLKLSEEEKQRRRDLDLPVTKPLRYMKEINGEYEEIPVKEYEVVAIYKPSGTVSLSITLENGEMVRIIGPFFSHMQKPSFIDDMKKGLSD